MIKKKNIFFLVITVLTVFEYAFSCTGFYIAKEDKIFACNNEDNPYPLTKMWTIPRSDHLYGRIYFGYDNFSPQGGINEKGLFFDAFASDKLPINVYDEKPKYDKFFDDIRNEIMATCSNVHDVIKFINNYNLSSNNLFENAMFLFGDAEGNSIIIDGSNIFTKSGDFQVVTNFHVSQNEEITCKRYLTATRMLKDLEMPSVFECRDVLDSVHASDTIYSQVYDLKNLKIYIYNFHNFNDCYEVNLKDEFKKGLTCYDLPSLFKYSEPYEEFKKQNWDKYSKVFNDLFNKNIGNQISNNYLGDYFHLTFQGPDLNVINLSDSLHTVSIKQVEAGICLRENFGCYGEFKLYPISDNKYFYLTRFYWAEIIFEPNNGFRLIAQLYDKSVKKWITRFKKGHNNGIKSD
jgi:hypothetical protein